MYGGDRILCVVSFGPRMSRCAQWRLSVAYRWAGSPSTRWTPTPAFVWLIFVTGCGEASWSDAPWEHVDLVSGSPDHPAQPPA